MSLPVEGAGNWGAFGFTTALAAALSAVCPAARTPARTAPAPNMRTAPLISGAASPPRVGRATFSISSKKAAATTVLMRYTPGTVMTTA